MIIPAYSGLVLPSLAQVLDLGFGVQAHLPIC